MKPFTDFFKISSKVFEKVVRVVGAYSDGKDEKYIRLKLPLAGIDTGNRKRR